MKSHVFLAAAIFLATSAHAQQAQIPDESLTGAWAEGQFERFHGQVIEFQADHRILMYPKCGREAEQLNKAGIKVYSGTWAIVDGHTLHLRFELGGKSMQMDSGIAFDGPVLKLTTSQRRATTMYRYSGPLPPACPG